MAAVIGLFHSHCVRPVLAGPPYKSNARAISAADVEERQPLDFTALSILTDDGGFGFPDASADCRSETRTPAPGVGLSRMRLTSHLFCYDAVTISRVGPQDVACPPYPQVRAAVAGAGPAGAGFRHCRFSHQRGHGLGRVAADRPPPA